MKMDSKKKNGKALKGGGVSSLPNSGCFYIFQRSFAKFSLKTMSRGKMEYTGMKPAEIPS